MRTLTLPGAFALLGALALCAATNAHAVTGDVLLSTAYSACMDKSNGVTAKMLHCTAAETELQDVRLNAAYKSLMAGLTPERKQKLIEVQRLWLKYREANCKFYADPDGGTIATVNANSCFLTTTAERAVELQHLAE